MVIYWIFVFYCDKDNVSIVLDFDERLSILIMMIICKCFSKKRVIEFCYGFYRWFVYLWERYRYFEIDSGFING